MPSIILSDNGASSGSAGLKSTAASDGALALQTTTSGGTATTAVSIDTSQNVTFTNAANLPNTFGFKNRIINGAMVIDQRNAGASGTGISPGYPVDRWGFNASQASKFTWQQNAGSVTPPAGFTNYIGLTSSSAYTLLSTDYFQLYQIIEANNMADLAFGTAAAQTVTLSFWVRSSLTGTFGASLAGIPNAGATVRSYPFNYTINSANTWEQKTITIPGDSAINTWYTGNQAGLFVRFGLGSGSSNTAAAGAWTTGNFIQPTGNVNVAGTNGATWYVTGVQLEKGSTATSFDFRSYGTELALCQRYYTTFLGQSTYSRAGVGVGVGTTSVTIGVSLPVVMRAITLTSTGPLGIYNGSSGVISVTSLAIDNPDTQYPTVLATVASGVNTAQPYQLLANNSTAARVNFSGEL